MIKNVKYFLIILFLYSCGYSPIYEVNQKINFGLDTITYSGNKKIGREIEKGLEKFRDNKNKNVFDVNFVSLKNKEIVTKDKKGDPSSYKLIIDIKLDLIDEINNKSFKKRFIRETTFDSMDNKFELDQYVNNIEKNMIFKILQDINIFFNVIENDL